MRTQDARQIPITDYLDRIGAKFARTQRGTNGLEYVYHSPNRDDRKPSLCVNAEKNIWSDVPEGVGGRLIELVCHINGLSFDEVSRALSILDSVFPVVKQSSNKVAGIISAPTQYRNTVSTQTTNTSLLSKNSKKGATGLKKKSGAIEIQQVKELYSFPLKEYLTQERKINLNIAGRYLKEVHCHISATNKAFYAIGFPSGSAYALRNRNFKGFAGTGADITIFDYKTSNILLFEGFMDFLSYLTAKNINEPSCTAVVLNSSAMIGRLINYVQNSPHISSVDYFRDRDELEGKNTGLKTLSDLKEQLPAIKINDKSEAYSEYKDLNDWLVSLF